MRAQAASLPSDDSGWAYEIKWDGYRTIASIIGDDVRLYSSNTLDVTQKWLHMQALATHVNASSVTLDGEMVCFDPSGRTRFSWLQQGTYPVTYVIFDVLAINGHSALRLPYTQRRQLLSSIIEPGGAWSVPDYQTGPGSGKRLFDETKANDAEGIIAKRLDGFYLPGKRSPSWRKMKHRKEQEFVVGGWKQGEGSRRATFGALLIGYYNDAGELQFAGKVGTGFTQVALETIAAQIYPLQQQTCPFATQPPRDVVREATWCAPTLVIQCEFMEWSHTGRIRQPTFLHLRDDKPASNVTNAP
jgi:bifunctional non-homologous end joining protein LigD